MGFGSSFGMGKNQFMGGLARTYGSHKKNEVGKIFNQAGTDFGKVSNKWGKTNEGKLIKGVIGGYMKHRTQINKGLKAINFTN